MAQAQGIRRIAVLDDYQRVARSLADWASLEPAARVTFFHDHVGDPAQAAARLEPFDAVVLMRERTRFDAALIERLPNLKLIVSVGMWNAAIDLEAAKARDILVCGTATGDPNATPALTWALVLGLARNLLGEANAVRAGGWQTGLGMDLTGKTLALLGLGRIGQVVARYGQAFGMRVIAWSQNLAPERAAELGVTPVGKDELFGEADVLSIHVRLSDRTRDLVGRRELALMKPTALLVNTSRGPIVSEPALVEALREGRLAGAALDVFEPEPLPADHPFRFLPNVLATPHIGYVTEGTYRTAYRDAVEDIRAWLAGQPVRVMTP